MDIGAVISYVLLLVALWGLVSSIIGIAIMFFKLTASVVMNKKYPAFSCTTALYVIVISLYYIILFCTGHVQF